MVFFRQPKPRTFHHEFIYADDHKQRVRKARQHAIDNSDDEIDVMIDEAEIHESFVKERKKRLDSRPRLPFISGLSISGLLLLIAIVMILWFILFK